MTETRHCFHCGKPIRWTGSFLWTHTDTHKALCIPGRYTNGLKAEPLEPVRARKAERA